MTFRVPSVTVTTPTPFFSPQCDKIPHFTEKPTKLNDNCRLANGFELEKPGHSGVKKILHLFYHVCWLVGESTKKKTPCPPAVSGLEARHQLLPLGEKSALMPKIVVFPPRRNWAQQGANLLNFRID